MFSGIVTCLGEIIRMSPEGAGYRLWISSPLSVAPKGEAGIGTMDRKRVGLGDSIACHGVCLTVDRLEPPHVFSVVCGFETWKTTCLAHFSVGMSLHLERALLVGDRLDGHIVQGHVDGVAEVYSNQKEAESWVLWLDMPYELHHYCATKGSITINGVSLTINEVEGSKVRVNIVPYTAEETALHMLTAGDIVNIEVDVLARYVERLLGANQSNSKLSFSKLREMGYKPWPKGGYKYEF